MTAPQMEAPGAVAAADQAQSNTQTDSAIVHDQDALRKRFEDLRARLALHNGMSLYALADGQYLVCMAAYSRALPTIEAVAAFVRQIGGAA